MKNEIIPDMGEPFERIRIASIPAILKQIEDEEHRFMIGVYLTLDDNDEEADYFEDRPTSDW